jgi:hypothetical protein
MWAIHGGRSQLGKGREPIRRHLFRQAALRSDRTVRPATGQVVWFIADGVSTALLRRARCEQLLTEPRLFDRQVWPDRDLVRCRSSSVSTLIR